MARRREPVAPVDAPPARFVYADWADEAADGPLPVWWSDGDTWMWHRIRAFKRYLAAKRARRAVL